MKKHILALAISTLSVISTAGAATINFAAMTDAPFAAANSLTATIGWLDISANPGTVPGFIPAGQSPRLGIGQGIGDRDGLGVYPETGLLNQGDPEVERTQSVTFEANDGRSFTGIMLGSVGREVTGRFDFLDDASRSFAFADQSPLGQISRTFSFASPYLGRLQLSISRGGVAVANIVATPLPASAWAMLLIGSGAVGVQVARRRRLRAA